MSENSTDGAPGKVVVVGSGLAGLATALGASLRGFEVTVLEAADLVGGAAAYSGGQVWVGANHVARRQGIEDSIELTERYLRAIAADHPEVLDEAAMHRWLQVAPIAAEYWEQVGAIEWEVIPGFEDYHNTADGALGEGRYLTNKVFDGRKLGEWRQRLRVTPHFPVGVRYEDMLKKGRRQATVDLPQHPGLPAFGMRGDGPAEEAGDPLTFGTGVVASFLHRVLQEDRVTILTGRRVVELLTDGDRVVGARAEGADGATSDHHGVVVLATSTYDWNPDQVREFLGIDPEHFGSVAPQSIRGDGIDLARSVGAAIVKMPPGAVPLIPGWDAPSSSSAAKLHPFAMGPEYAMPHSMMVDRHGRRFANDSYWVDIVAKLMAPGADHFPFFLIWDEQHHRKYGLGETAPGEDYPAELVTSAPTLAELGRALGIDGDELERTARTFSEHAARGEDPEFGRGTVDHVNSMSGDPGNEPNPVLGPIEEPPFHGMRLRLLGTAIGSTGISVDADAHVLDESGRVIPGLYAAGAAAAITTMGTGYNSGFSLARGITHAYLIAEELAGNPVP